MERRILAHESHESQREILNRVAHASGTRELIGH